MPKLRICAQTGCGERIARTHPRIVCDPCFDALPEKVRAGGFDGVWLYLRRSPPPKRKRYGPRVRTLGDRVYELEDCG